MEESSRREHMLSARPKKMTKGSEVDTPSVCVLWQLFGNFAEPFIPFKSQWRVIVLVLTKCLIRRKVERMIQYILVRSTKYYYLHRLSFRQNKERRPHSYLPFVPKPKQPCCCINYFICPPFPPQGRLPILHSFLQAWLASTCSKRNRRSVGSP